VTLDGYEFVRACNEFGGGLVSKFKELDVPVSFRRTRSRFHLDGKILDLPPTPASLPRLLASFPSLAGLFLAQRRHRCNYLSELIDRHATNPEVIDLLGVVAYVAAVP